MSANKKNDECPEQPVPLSSNPMPEELARAFFRLSPEDAWKFASVGYSHDSANERNQADDI
ncbi:MAG: hypothetical protein OXH22_13995 [Chloroflexi bacterium]|nr:hypothetical protein [Chloroflexota bacterium]